MKRRFLFLAFCFLISSAQLLQAQLMPVDYSYNNYRNVYIDSNRMFTAWKPVFAADTAYYSLNKDTAHTWFHRKLFNEHLFQFNNKDYNIYIDFMPDFVGGVDDNNKKSKTYWTNTRGARVQGNIGKNFYFEADLYENQATFPQYLDSFIRMENVIPGQGEPKINSTNFDYSSSSALLFYKPSKYVDFTLGYGKNFLGDGYRSLLLSDVAFNYPYLKVTGTLGNFQYTSMWAQFIDKKTPAFTYNTGYPKKWGVFHYLDWQVNKKLSVGLFESIIWQDADSSIKRGFDVSYLNPLVILRPVEFANGSPDNAQIGFNAKFKLNNNMQFYGQLMFDEFKVKEMLSSDGWWGNKYAWQLGVRGYNLFKVPNLDYQLEYNQVRPYTYSHNSTLQNYGHYNESLAHPLGANFKELQAFLFYRLKRWYFQWQGMYAMYGVDGPDGVNYGKDIFESYTTHIEYGNKTGQGYKTHLYYTNLQAAYILNPRYNLRIEGNVSYRKESNSLGNYNGPIFNIGFRSSFRRFYYDR